MEDIKKQVINDLKGAKEMVGQAQNRLGYTASAAKERGDLELWTKLGELFDQVDNMIEEVKN